MGRCFLVVALVGCITLPVFGQCPQDHTANGPTVTLDGQLSFHDSIQPWFELKLDQPQCAQPSIELMSRRPDGPLLEMFRGCRVRSRGVINLSPTAAYSLEIYQDVDSIEPIGTCRRQSRFPDFTDAKPDEMIRQYEVDMHFNFEPGDHPIVYSISSGSKSLQPWQAYATFFPDR